MNGRPWIGRDLVLDTNVLIHLARGRSTHRWLTETYGFDQRDTPFVSVASIAEAFSMAEGLAWNRDKLTRLRAAINRCIARDIASDDKDLIDAYVKLDQESHKAGTRMGKNDLWIAAETHRLGAVLVTSDKDFDRLATDGWIHVDVYQEVPKVPVGG